MTHTVERRKGKRGYKDKIKGEKFEIYHNHDNRCNKKKAVTSR